ncbi:MAG: pyridoxamine 5'-phosphate oxidase family protein [Defluviitaleaceae bacterium]|nr:pyridoxamine 5'-phosphate oxidase family protein [Defluviitaleaceae bacterium]
MNHFENAEKIMVERFGQDSLIALATTEDGKPFVRTVDGYYEDGAFYVVTYTLSKKMKQIAKSPEVAISGEWFTGHGIGENLGHVMLDANKDIMEKLRKAFAAWYTGGHVDESDENTCLLRICLTNGIITDHSMKYGERYFSVDFTNKSAT